ncbi:hypothetical protein AB5N19_04538 [Seiridium cardinale]
MGTFHELLEVKNEQESVPSSNEPSKLPVPDVPRQKCPFTKFLVQNIRIEHTEDGIVRRFWNPRSRCEGYVLVDHIPNASTGELDTRSRPGIFHSDTCGCYWWEREGEHTTGIWPWKLNGFARRLIEEELIDREYEPMFVCMLHLKARLPKELRYPEGIEAYYRMFEESVDIKVECEDTFCMLVDGEYVLKKDIDSGKYQATANNELNRSDSLEDLLPLHAEKKPYLSVE